LADSLDLDFAIIHNDGQGFLPGEKEEGITLVGEVENKVAFLVVIIYSGYSLVRKITSIIGRHVR
jgi:phosphoribosylpyrophosphate synthetase